MGFTRRVGEGRGVPGGSAFTFSHHGPVPACVLVWGGKKILRRQIGTFAMGVRLRAFKLSFGDVTTCVIVKTGRSSWELGEGRCTFYF